MFFIDIYGSYGLLHFVRNDEKGVGVIARICVDVCIAIFEFVIVRFYGVESTFYTKSLLACH